MTEAKKGDTVKVHYRGTLDDGTLFDSSEGGEPLQFEVGSGQVIPGFDEAVEGLETGQSRSVRIPYDQAYGPKRKDLIFPVDRKAFPFEPEVGMKVRMTLPDRGSLLAVVRSIAGDQVVLDCNHELAGKDLNFEITLMEIVRE